MAAVQAFVGAPAGSLRQSGTTLQVGPVIPTSNVAAGQSGAVLPSMSTSAVGAALLVFGSAAVGNRRHQKRSKTHAIALKAVRRPCHGGEH
eukprot:CAMPEP_0185908376 /NCGR_PEP_ID=MMETSP0196C-20130402/8714_1 /TAXON_ID=2932 /ORGANISM="Alexandrium fundyense, Strain CCMP1719" /LENGTH=90 /DNA_ID=CAMNT_0028628595 /DNA_START=98 /DNA_END=367 /DNA_ORIENTATION=+